MRLSECLHWSSAVEKHFAPCTLLEQTQQYLPTILFFFLLISQRMSMWVSVHKAHADHTFVDYQFCLSVFLFTTHFSESSVISSTVFLKPWHSFHEKRRRGFSVSNDYCMDSAPAYHFCNLLILMEYSSYNCQQDWNLRFFIATCKAKPFNTG